jgi:tetratricopeptide (TPR) repeat protein
MAYKLNPFKKANQAEASSNLDLGGDANSQHPLSIGSNSNNSNFKALLEQFGGGAGSTSSQPKEAPRTNYRPFSSSMNGKNSSNANSNNSTCQALGTVDKNSSPRPPTISRTKSAPVPTSPEKAARAMSPPVRPPVHPQSNAVIPNNMNRKQSGNRSRTSSHDSKSTTVQSISNHSTGNNGGSITLSNKSHVRTVLEQVASKYFLPQCDKRVVYVGVEDYGLGGGMNSSILGLESGDREALLAFLEVGGDEDGEENCDEHEIENKRMDNIKGDDSTADVTEDKGDSVKSDGGSQAELQASVADKHRDAKQQTFDTSSSIDLLLEQASEHLSLGKNAQALQSYRSAMKAAYANVIQVKNQLVKVKQEQIKLQYEQKDAKDVGLSEYVDDNDIELTKQQEREFELLLLQVASRVADIHNNMGVVHEMDRQFQKAKSSYQDALDVYHNTCRRFEQTGDADVERTHRNVTRMTAACNSEKERKDLHSQASRIAKQVDKEKTFEARKKLLNDAVSTLQHTLEVETRTVGESHPVAASTLIQMGKYHYEMREFDLSVMEIRRAVNILCDALGPNHPQVGKAILLLASVYERNGLNVSPRGTNKDDATLELYVDALDPLKATLTEVHPEVGFLYIKIGYLYSKKGDRNLSALAYKAALKAYGEPWSTDKVHPEVVSTWVRLTDELTELKCWQEVLTAGRRALFLLRQAKSTLYKDAQLLASNKNDGTQSKSKSSKVSPIQITSSTYYDALSTTLQCLGVAHTSLSQYQQATLACKESLQLAWEGALANSAVEPSDPLKPNDDAIVSSLLSIIRALKRLGKVLLLQKHYTESLECFLPALQLLRSSNQLESSLDSASVLGSLGFLHLKMERFVEASNFFRECLRLYQQNGKLGGRFIEN